MGKEIITFGSIEVEKQKFCQYKSLISIYDVNIDKIVVPIGVLFGKIGFKYFIDYKNSKEIRPLCVMLPKMSAYRRNFDETKYMPFFDKS